MIIDKSQRIFTIPNILSMMRLCLITVFMYTYLNASTKEEYLMAAYIFFVSAVTDCLDGFIARTFNQVTELGKLLDPIADKLTQTTLLICLSYHFRYMWILALICIGKDLFMAVMGVVMIKYKRRKLNGAKWYGKVSTAYAYAVILVLLLFPDLNYTTAGVLMSTCGFLMILSIMLYINVFIKMWKGEN